VSEIATLPDVQVRPREKQTTRTLRLPPFNVILENDDYHTYPFVIEVLCKALGYTEMRAYQLTEEAHRSGRAIVWSGSKEVAELKVEQIQSFHEISASGEKFGPLGVTIEPAPG
jgi:ATP-dependent Clp protease adaptor protein ClpS